MTTFICCGCAYGCVPTTLRPLMPTKLVEFCTQIWATLSWYVIVKWGELGCWPNPYSSHIHVIYIKGVWQPVYAVDVNMDVSPPSYGRSCWPSLWNFATNLGKSHMMWWWNEVIEAIDPTHIHLTSILYIYKVFDNLYMLWMCIWMCPHHLMAAHVDQAFGILPQIWASLCWYVMVKWGVWGCRPNPYSSHINAMYTRCLTTCICCGCAYGCVPTTLRPLVPTKLVEFCYKSGHLPADKW